MNKDIHDILELYQLIIGLKEFLCNKKIYFEGGDDYQIYFHVNIEINNKPCAQRYYVSLEKDEVVPKMHSYYDGLYDHRYQGKGIDNSIIWDYDLRTDSKTAAEKTVELFEKYKQDYNELLIKPLQQKIIKYI